VIEKLKSIGLVVLSVLAVSFGIGWGFSHMLKRSAEKKANEAEKLNRAQKKEITAIQTLVNSRERTRKEVAIERQKLETGDLDAYADSLFR
jgi:hypothetical protein